ncbi:MAG: protein-L-isoaspartate(D-aspartate) O-methyltransferase [Bacteroidetes bacterium]|nr:MAG: protein-L-isoaspartate(D-aspartate) O-methyltransferase [Bacteroidota bacterium]
MFQDTFQHKGLRKKLVQELAAKGITDSKVLEAINKVPRHWFIDSVFLKHAYEDKAFQIGAGQTISHPYTVAFQTSLLQVEKGEKILEIGTGSGYQTAVLLELGAKVFSIERQRLLYSKTKKLLEKTKYAKAKLFYGDGYEGLPAFAPFDKILVTAGAPSIPEKLLEQLKPGGKMIIPVGEEEKQVMHEIIKTSENNYDFKTYGNFKFVPMLQKKEWKV